MNGLVLLIEDNEHILHGNERMLRRRGYEVICALTLGEARAKMLEAKPDVVVLDIMMPDGNGLDFIHEIRRKSNTPVLLLTGLTTPEDIVRGLREGSDDYLTKPYDFNVLLARVEALIRRAEQMPEVFRRGALKLDVMAGQALLEGEDLLLTKKEISLLLLFVQNEGRAISAEYIYEKVWGQPMAHSTQAVKKAVSRLREKLTESEYTVLAVRGKGYCFEKQ